jgi:hypothetical protein
MQYPFHTRHAPTSSSNDLTAASRRLMLKPWHDNVDEYSHLRVAFDRTSTI